MNKHTGQSLDEFLNEVVDEFVGEHDHADIDPLKHLQDAYNQLRKSYDDLVASTSKLEHKLKHAEEVLFNIVTHTQTDEFARNMGKAYFEEGL